MAQEKQCIIDSVDTSNENKVPDIPAMSTEEFQDRITLSTSLVIGADMHSHHDISNWQKLDQNYIGIRDWDNTWKSLNDNKLIDWNDEYPEEKYNEGRPSLYFLPLMDKYLPPNKFKLIIVDGGTRHYIYDMKTLFKLAQAHIEQKHGLLIYPVRKNTMRFCKGFLRGIENSSSDSDASFTSYYGETEDIEKSMNHNLDLVGFIKMNKLGLCYVMKYRKKEEITRCDIRKYSIIKRLIFIKDQSELFMTYIREFRKTRKIMIDNWEIIKQEFFSKATKTGWDTKKVENYWKFLEFHPLPTGEITGEEKPTSDSYPDSRENLKKWKEIKNNINLEKKDWEFLSTNSTKPTDLTTKDAMRYLGITYRINDSDLQQIKDEMTGEEQPIQKIKQKIEEEKKVEEEFISAKILDIEFSDIKHYIEKRDNNKFTKLLGEYESLNTDLITVPPPQDTCYMNKSNEDPAGERDCISICSPDREPNSPPLSPAHSAPHSAPNSPHRFNRKSVRKPLRKSLRKSVRKSLRKSVRKPLRKSARKSKRKSVRKPLQKSLRKSKRKSVRKPLRKSLRKSVRKPLPKSSRKSKRKSVRKPLRKSSRKSKRKSVRKPLRKSSRKSKRKSVRKPLRKSSRKSVRKSRR